MGRWGVGGWWWGRLRAFLDWKVDYGFGCFVCLRQGFGQSRRGVFDLALGHWGVVECPVLLLGSCGGFCERVLRDVAVVGWASYYMRVADD